MFGFDRLRALRSVEGESVQCPVAGCATQVPKQRRTFRRAPVFLCPIHRLYIGASTFEYESEAGNLLSYTQEDQELLAAIRKVKRESRMARERSEDALTWNVFRHLEKSGRLMPWLTELTGTPSSTAAVHYWSFDRSTGETWAPLAEARTASGEVAGRGSEPDLVITTDDAHVWVEAKLASSNSTQPSDAGGALIRYTTGAAGWCASVVTSPFDLVAVEQRRYELLRLWLLGSWAAARLGKRFVLVNLVREGFEEDVPGFAATHFRQNPGRLVHRCTWESVFRRAEGAPQHTAADKALLKYFAEKTLGYDGRGRLIRAFAVD